MTKEVPVLYAVFCYNTESVIGAWSKEQDDAVMAHHGTVLTKLNGERKLGPVARLMPTTAAVTLRPGSNQDPIVLDGPFAETKEQLLGFYILDCASLEEVIEAVRDLVVAPGALEIRPVMFFEPGSGVT
jgi:hypothetical protein